MFPKILSKIAEQSLGILKRVSVFQNAYLAGGTALALQLGHRYSYDIHKIVTLQEVLELYEKKFGKLAQNKVHILKSLVYFDDAERDAPPQMIQKVNWSLVKKFFVAEEKSIAQLLFS